MGRIIAESIPKKGAASKRVKPKGRLLLVDDDKKLADAVKSHLEKEGYEVLRAQNGEEGLVAARKQKPDLVLLDVMMPKMDGLELLKALRQEGHVPVLMLTGRHSDLGQILGLKLGADDYVFKPFCAEVLTARVEALLRRSAPSADTKGLQRLGNVTVDPDRREVRVDGKPIEFTIKEFNVLNALIAARGKVLSREYLLSTVWEINEDCDIRTRTVDQHIAGIRQKLGAEGKRVLTVPHFGYRIDLS